jgi:hypothetical protein
MSRQDREPVGPTATKGVAAVLLVLLALAFGAFGACGVWVTGSGIRDTVSQLRGAPRNDYTGAGIEIGAVCAVVGLGVAVAAGWAAVLMFRKKSDRED